jgi:hypothetical protein
MAPTPPARTDQERQDALRRALEARQARAKIKDAVTAGDMTVAEVLDRGHRGATDELGQHARVAGRIEIGDLLLAVDGVGPAHTADILESAGVQDGHEHLDELNADQVQKIKDIIGG